MKQIIYFPFAKQPEYQALPRPDKLLLIGIYMQWNNSGETNQLLEYVNHTEIHEITGDVSIDLHTLSNRKWRLLLQFGLIRIDNTITFIIDKKTDSTANLTKEGSNITRYWYNKGGGKICQKKTPFVKKTDTSDRKLDTNDRKSVRNARKIDTNDVKFDGNDVFSDKQAQNPNAINSQKPCVHPNFSGSTQPKFLKKK
ncbi:MAG TPA: hypothetical protein DCF91_01575 [Porphyromonadaceae bacterium]|nr:hypothetical protein [Porphyromonadaceae bacterium]